MAIYEELEIDQGSTFRYQVDLTTSQGSAYDLGGFTLTSSIKKNYKSTTSAGSFALSSPSAGRILMEMDDSDASNIAAGRYVFDVYIEAPSGERYRVIEGMVTVTPSVTQQ